MGAAGWPEKRLAHSFFEMIYLSKITTRAMACGAYPLNRPVLLGLELQLDRPVTLLAGENGSGKSTLMEALACKMNLPTVGSSDVSRDEGLKKLEPLQAILRLNFKKPTQRGFFLRAEDFFGFVHRIEAQRAEMKAELARVEREYAGHSRFTQDQARMAYQSALGDIEGRYGEDMDAASHGESFLGLFRSRMNGPGIFLLDEPETPLSILSQLALISMIREREADSQFIIATHSPVLLAYPGAAIYSLDGARIQRTSYDELESVGLMRDFLKAPERYLKHL